eukprot:1588548-Prymnesium_polylepis.1
MKPGHCTILEVSAFSHVAACSPIHARSILCLEAAARLAVRAADGGLRAPAGRARLWQDCQRQRPVEEGRRGGPVGRSALFRPAGAGPRRDDVGRGKTSKGADRR